MNAKRTHIVIPVDLASDIDALVGRRHRSGFLVQAAQRELVRIRQLKALDEAAGAWKDKDHPELKAGAAAWVRSLRQESEGRVRKASH